MVFRARALVLVLVPVLVLALSSMHTPIPSRRISDIRFLGHMTKSRGRKSFFLLLFFFFFSWGRQGERVEEGTLVRYLSLGGFQEEEGNTWNSKVL